MTTPSSLGDDGLLRTLLTSSTPEPSSPVPLVIVADVGADVSNPPSDKDVGEFGVAAKPAPTDLESDYVGIVANDCGNAVDLSATCVGGQRDPSSRFYETVMMTQDGQTRLVYACSVCDKRYALRRSANSHWYVKHRQRNAEASVQSCRPTADVIPLQASDYGAIRRLPEPLLLSAGGSRLKYATDHVMTASQAPLYDVAMGQQLYAKSTLHQQQFCAGIGIDGFDLSKRTGMPFPLSAASSTVTAAAHARCLTSDNGARWDNSGVFNFPSRSAMPLQCQPQTATAAALWNEPQTTFSNVVERRVRDSSPFLFNVNLESDANQFGETASAARLGSQRDGSWKFCENVESNRRSSSTSASSLLPVRSEFLRIRFDGGSNGKLLPRQPGNVDDMESRPSNQTTGVTSQVPVTDRWPTDYSGDGLWHHNYRPSYRIDQPTGPLYSITEPANPPTGALPGQLMESSSPTSCFRHVTGYRFDEGVVTADSTEREMSTGNRQQSGSSPDDQRARPPKKNRRFFSGDDLHLVSDNCRDGAATTTTKYIPDRSSILIGSVARRCAQIQRLLDIERGLCHFAAKMLLQLPKAEQAPLLRYSQFRATAPNTSQATAAAAASVAVTHASSQADTRNQFCRTGVILAPPKCRPNRRLLQCRYCQYVTDNLLTLRRHEGRHGSSGIDCRSTSESLTVGRRGHIIDVDGLVDRNTGERDVNLKGVELTADQQPRLADVLSTSRVDDCFAMRGHRLGVLASSEPMVDLANGVDDVGNNADLGNQLRSPIPVELDNPLQSTPPDEILG